MDDSTYLRIKELIDEKLAQMRRIELSINAQAEKVQKLTNLVTKISQDLAERGDSN